MFVNSSIVYFQCPIRKHTGSNYLSLPWFLLFEQLLSTVFQSRCVSSEISQSSCRPVFEVKPLNYWPLCTVRDMHTPQWNVISTTNSSLRYSPTFSRVPPIICPSRWLLTFSSDTFVCFCLHDTPCVNSAYTPTIDRPPWCPLLLLLIYCGVMTTWASGEILVDGLRCIA